MNDVSQLSPKYVSPHQVTVITAISRNTLANLIKAGSIKAKRIALQTVVVEWDSVLKYLDSLPDIVGDSEIEARPKEVTVATAMEAYNDQRRKALDFFSEAQVRETQE
jgi:hypothetical protein